MFVANITLTGSAMVNWNRTHLIQGVTTVLWCNLCTGPLSVDVQGFEKGQLLAASVHCYVW